MKKVIPYEAKGKMIMDLPIQTLKEATVVKDWYLSENDPWLKKLLAMKLLEFDNFSALKLDICEFEIIIKCQVNF